MPVVPIPRRRDVATDVVPDAVVASGIAAASADPAMKNIAGAASDSAVATGSIVVVAAAVDKTTAVVASVIPSFSSSHI